MGEIAEMMLDGTLCQSCGVYIGSDNDFPTSCFDCVGNKRSGSSYEHRKRRRSKNLENLKKFDKRGWAQFSPYHFRLAIKGKNLDYWPSTKRVRYGNETKFLNMSDLKKFIRELKK